MGEVVNEMIGRLLVQLGPVDFASHAVKDALRRSVETTYDQNK